MSDYSLAHELRSVAYRRPFGGVPVQLVLLSEDQPSFRWVLRKHHATFLHFDFRLQVLGTLLSFALNQPPSFDPRYPVGAKLMNDHDPRYLLSERRIPEGCRGAGPTMAVDYGVYTPEPQRYTTYELDMLHQLAEGEFRFHLRGHFLKGLWRLYGRGENWSIQKVVDEFASKKNRPTFDRSIITGRSLYEI